MKDILTLCLSSSLSDVLSEILNTCFLATSPNRSLLSNEVPMWRKENAASAKVECLKSVLENEITCAFTSGLPLVKQSRS